MTVVSQRELTLTSSRRCLAAAKRGRRRSHRPVLPAFFALALGPHPQRELTLMLRRGVAWPQRSVAAGAPVVFRVRPRRFCQPAYLPMPNVLLMPPVLAVAVVEWIAMRRERATHPG